MIYLILILIVYNLILTLFVIRINNKLEEKKSQEVLPSPPPSVNLEEELNKFFASKSREEIESWIKEEDNKNATPEQSKKLNNLNGDYKQY